MPRTSARTAPDPTSRPAPAWLLHPLRWQRAPVPWAAVGRGALGAGPLLALALATGHPAAGVLAGLGAMLAGVNDRPGTRRRGLVHIGLPALAGTAGICAGSLLNAPGLPSWWAVPVLFALGLFSGAVSATTPVSSAAAMQLLVTTTVGAGMPLPGAAWFKALCFLGGACWLLALRLVLRPPRPSGGALPGERAALAEVFTALADALDAVGRPGAEAARRRLTGALDRADEALRLTRLLRPVRRAGPAELLFAERLAAATALCEASVALLREGRVLPSRVADGPRRLARAVREGRRPGPLPAPVAGTAASRHFDRTLLEAAVVFGRSRPAGDGADPHAVPSPRHPALRHRRTALGPAGLEYGLRVAVCVSASAAVALTLGSEHWFWLPVTAAFLVKPDLGPLFSRVVNRFAGTAAGVLVFAGLGTVADGVLPSGVGWPVPVVAVAGALIPVATRHFAFQTGVVTVLVLALLHTVGDTGAAGPRLTHTAVACALVLLAGHLPFLVAPHARPRQRLAAALHRTRAYVAHVLADPAGEPGEAERRALRRAAYRALGEARAAA
ncbi:FUSC family protein, partial [Streptomyces sp. HNM0574]|uniref:FUSC family protein n=1 Tax=Streptomyces sp. HNM0574 TaxID=2714954 RepID=UPI00146D7DBC|nr:FUSC family protein [Streptomyces sp. HNM0574]